MTIREKAKKLITASLVISPERRAFLLALTDHLHLDQCKVLIQVFESENQRVQEMLANKLKKDPSKAKEFDQTLTKIQKKHLKKAEVSSHINEEVEIMNLEEQINLLA